MSGRKAERERKKRKKREEKSRRKERRTNNICLYQTDPNDGEERWKSRRTNKQRNITQNKNRIGCCKGRISSNAQQLVAFTRRSARRGNSLPSPSHIGDHIGESVCLYVCIACTSKLPSRPSLLGVSRPSQLAMIDRRARIIKVGNSGYLLVPTATATAAAKAKYRTSYIPRTSRAYAIQRGRCGARCVVCGAWPPSPPQLTRGRKRGMDRGGHPTPTPKPTPTSRTH